MPLNRSHDGPDFSSHGSSHSSHGDHTEKIEVPFTVFDWQRIEKLSDLFREYIVQSRKEMDALNLAIIQTRNDAKERADKSDEKIAEANKQISRIEKRNSKWAAMGSGAVLTVAALWFVVQLWEKLMIIIGLTNGHAGK